MIDATTAMRVFDRLPAEDQQFIRDEASRRGLPIGRVTLEQSLGGLGGVEQMLYSHINRKAPALRLVK